MDISPDSIELWRSGAVVINVTLLFTWVVMAVMVVGSWMVTRRLASGTHISRWQNALEVVVDGMRNQVREIGGADGDRYLPFAGTLFLFIAVSNLLTILPGYSPPTASLSTTAALAGCVFVAVPVFGITGQGLRAYLRHYVDPTPLMLPFHLLGELSRTLALAIRLFGNVMSGTKIVAVLVMIVPLFFPILMTALGLLTGLIQAYIFAILATVYIASGTRVQADARTQVREEQEEGVFHE